MNPPTRVREWLLAVVATSAVLVPFAGTRALFDADEGRYAAVAANMVARGDYVVPHLNGMPFMDKPPLVYWIQAIGIHGAGPSPFVARMPTLLAGVLWCLAIFAFSLRLTRRRADAWCSLGISATSLAGIVGSRVGPQMDMPLAAAVAWALYAGFRWLEGGGRRFSTLMGVAVGCGLLIKGPLAVAVPALVGLAWCAAGASWKRFFGLLVSPVAWGIALAIAAPWYILVERAMPGWIAHFVQYEHFGRFSQGDHRNFHPFWFYVPIALSYVFPWTPLLWRRNTAPRAWVHTCLGPFSIRTWRDTWEQAKTPAKNNSLTVPTPGTVCFLWFVTAFCLYSVATRKLLNYLLPAAAPLFVLAGTRLATLNRRATRSYRWGLVAFGMGLIVLAVVIANAWWLPLQTGSMETRVDAPRWQGLILPLIAAGVLLLVGTWCASRMSSTRRLLLTFVVVAGTWGIVELGMARVSALGSAEALAKAVDRFVPDGEALVCFKRYPQGLDYYSSTPAYLAGGGPGNWLQREIVEPYASRAKARQHFTPSFRGGLLTSEEFDAWWSGEAVPGVAASVLLCRHGELKYFGGEVLAGPFAGAGRTDLWLIRRPKPK